MVEVEQLKELTLGDALGEVAISVNGVRIEVHTTGNVDVYGDVDVASHRAPLQTQAPRELKIGDPMPDGTKYAGVSPDTGKAMYALPADAKLTMKWKDAMEYAANFQAPGQPKGSFRVPTKDELDVLLQNKASIGGFNETASIHARVYWSSREYSVTADDVWVQSSGGHGYRGWTHKSYRASVRLVRG